MIVIDRLAFTYPAQRKMPPKVALTGLSLSVSAGEFVILAGPNGSGKSTLFKILCGMAVPKSGRVAVDGYDLVTDAREVRQRIGVVFQSPALDEHLTVRENIALHGALYGLTGRTLAGRIEAAAGWSKIAERMDEPVMALSGGLKRQVELVKALLPEPPVLLLDEPTTGLDPANRRAFSEALRAVQAERELTVLMTSHVFAEAEEADRVAIMRDGALIAYETPQALRAGMGQEMLVIEGEDPDRLLAHLSEATGRDFRRAGPEIRLADLSRDDALSLSKDVLGRFSGEIVSLSIRRPSLDDVFVHLTGAAPDAERNAA